MSDDEEVEYSEEEDEPEEREEEAEEIKEKKPPSVTRERITTTGDESSLTEAEKAMIAAKKRHADDDDAKLQDYEDKRRIEREREEEELRLLKEKQEQRRIQREEEERAEEERRLAEEERRKAEEEERKAKIEAERKKKEEEKERKRQQMMSGFATGNATGGRNFVLPEKKKDQGDKFGNIVQAKQEMGMTKDQRAEAKIGFLAQIEKQIGDMSSMNGNELRGKIKEMHQRICKLEAEKYDMEKRVSSQEYDLKELNERQRNMNRTKLTRKNGPVDPKDANSRFPPKVSIISKYDRQIDRRNFKERRAIYDKKNAFPCFPNVGPPPTILEFSVPSDNASTGRGEEDDEEEEE